MTEDRDTISESVKDQLNGQDMTIGDVKEELTEDKQKDHKDYLRERFQGMAEVHKIANCLPENTSVKITDDGNITLFGFSDALSYQPEFRQEPDDSKNDWAFFVNGSFKGWNTMSGGLSILKGYKCSPSKIMKSNWKEKEKINISIHNPKEHEEYSVLILSERAFMEEDNE